MATVNALILRAPGTNCDEEACYAFERAGARAERVHVNAALAEHKLFDRFQVLVLPGGFSYGDDVAAGKILANQLRLRLSEQLRSFRDSGKLVLGICNGFQVLIKAGLLPGWSADDTQAATLAHNDSGKFEDRWIYLRASGRCVFLNGVETMHLPIAHGEGKFVCRDESVLKRLESNEQVAVRYAPPGTSPTDPAQPLPYPINPNGSIANIAGICDDTGRVFGLMPHPERFVDAVQHPRWTRESPGDVGDGLAVFRNAVRYFA